MWRQERGRPAARRANRPFLFDPPLQLRPDYSRRATWRLRCSDSLRVSARVRAMPELACLFLAGQVGRPDRPHPTVAKKKLLNTAFAQVYGGTMPTDLLTVERH